MNISFFNDWLEERFFGEGNLAGLVADVVDQAMALGSGSADTGLEESQLHEVWDVAQAETDQSVKDRTAILLGRLGYEPALPALEYAEKANDPSISSPAVIVMAKLRPIDNEIFDKLSKIMRNPAEPRELRSAAARFIGQQNSAKSLALLLRAADAEDTDLAQYGVEGLSYMKPKPDTQEYNAIFKTLMACVKRDDAALKFAAAEALGRFGDDRAIPSLEEMLIEKDPAVRRRMVCALANLGADSAKSALARMLRDHSVPARWELVDVAALGYGEEMVEAFGAALKECDVEMLDHMVAMLAKMDGQGSLTLLTKIAHEASDKYVKEQAEEAIAKRRAYMPTPPQAPEPQVAASVPEPVIPKPAPEPPRHFELPGQKTVKPIVQPAPAPKPGAKLTPLFAPAPAGRSAIEDVLRSFDCQWTVDAGGYRVTVPVGNIFEKVTIVTGQHDSENAPIYRFIIECGPANPAAFEAALRNNCALDYGAISIMDSQGAPVFVLSDTLPAASVNAAAIKKAITSLARSAAEMRC